MWKFVQVEFHPKLYQKELLEYCKRKGIQLQAYTSLGQGKVCYSAWTFYYFDHDFEEACCNAPACMCNLDWHKRFYRFYRYWKRTCIYVQQLVSPSKLHLTVALGNCKLDDSPVVAFEKIVQWKSSCMQMTISSLGITTTWSIWHSLMIISLLWDFCFVLKALRWTYSMLHSCKLQ